MPPKRARNTRTQSSTYVVQKTTEQTSPPLQDPIEQVSKRPNLTVEQIKGKDEWSLFSDLVDGSNATLAEQPAKKAMIILASTFGPIDPVKQEIVHKNIVVKRVGAKITAHHIEQKSLTLTMQDLSEPTLWFRMILDIFSTKTLPPPVLPVVSHQMQLLLALCARLPPIKKLVVHKQGQEIVLNIIGNGFDAIVRIIGEQVLENRRFPQFCVPWSISPQANTALGTQILMIPDGATTIYVEIMATPAGGYIGVHDYGIGMFVCLSLSNAMKKYRLNKPTLIMLNTINPSLVVFKTPNSPFHGTIEQIENKNSLFVWLKGGIRFFRSEVENLDTILSQFSQQGKL